MAGAVLQHKHQHLSSRRDDRALTPREEVGGSRKTEAAKTWICPSDSSSENQPCKMRPLADGHWTAPGVFRICQFTTAHHVSEVQAVATVMEMVRRALLRGTEASWGRPEQYPTSRAQPVVGLAAAKQSPGNTSQAERSEARKPV